MNWKKLLPLVGIVILVYILWRFDIGKIISVFSTVNPLYAALCFLGMPIVYLIANTEWQIILKKQRIHVSFISSLKTMFIGYFYGFVTPGGFGSYLCSLNLKNESKAPLPKCLSNIITFNTIDYINIFFMGSIGGLFLLGQYPYLLLFILILLFCMCFLFIFYLRQKTSKHLFERLLRTQIFKFIQQHVEDPIETFYEDLPSFKSLLVPFLISIFNLIFFYTILFFVAQLFNIHIPYLTFLFMLGITSSIATIPISVYGLGTRDAVVVALFSLYSIPPENCISFTLFWFILFSVTASITGAIVTVFENKKLPSRKQK
jgi:uncharacterized protein (TIRG00374 family)